MHYTTIYRLQKYDPIYGKDLISRLSSIYTEDTPISLDIVLASSDIKTAAHVLCTVEDIDDLIRLYAVRCIRQSCQHMLTDLRSLYALDVAERYAVGYATHAELCTAQTLALDAGYEASGAPDGASHHRGTRAAAWAAHCVTCDDINRVIAAVEQASDAALCPTLSLYTAFLNGCKVAWTDIELDYKAIFCDEHTLPL